MVTKITEIGSPPTNGAQAIIDDLQPYVVEVVIQGVADLLFHRWNAESVDAKASAAKNSKAKKTDDIESYVYRNTERELCIPGEYLRMAIVGAAKFKQDPRSPRKSAMDLFKAAIVSLTPLASLGVTDWDYEDRRRCVVQRQGINRTRPAMKVGWAATFALMCGTPEYINTLLLNETIQMAGRLIGLGDFRPTFGRFTIAHFSLMDMQD
jgi:hypothetical protein